VYVKDGKPLTPSINSPEGQSMKVLRLESKSRVEGSVTGDFADRIENDVRRELPWIDCSDRRPRRTVGEGGFIPSTRIERSL
jgi:hypothetical protein